MTLYQELKEHVVLIDRWNKTKSLPRTQNTIDEVQAMLKIYEKHTGVDTTCPTCTTKNFERVVNWYNQEKKKFQLRGAKRNKVESKETNP